LSFLIATQTLAASPPKPTKSKYLQTSFAKFTISRSRRAGNYEMEYRLLRFPVPQMYIEVSFQDPESPQSQLRVEQSIPSNSLDFVVRSPEFRKAQNGRLYAVQLLLYSDPARKRLIDKHVQSVLLYFSPQQLPQVQQFFEVYDRLTELGSEFFRWRCC
jgi:hypothetical protein